MPRGAKEKGRRLALLSCHMLQIVQSRWPLSTRAPVIIRMQVGHLDEPLVEKRLLFLDLMLQFGYGLFRPLEPRLGTNDS